MLRYANRHVIHANRRLGYFLGLTRTGDRADGRTDSNEWMGGLRDNSAKSAQSRNIFGRTLDIWTVEAGLQCRGQREGTAWELGDRSQHKMIVQWISLTNWLKWSPVSVLQRSRKSLDP